MPRVVTTLRYVTTLGFMAYLTGMRVTGSSAWISSTKRAYLTHLSSLERTRRTVAESAYLTAILDMSGVFLSKRLSNLRVRWDVKNVTGWTVEPGGPSRDLWVALVLQHSKETSRSISSTELTPGTCLGHNDVGDPPGRPGLHCLTRQSDKGAPGPRAPQALRPRECPGAQDHPDRTYMPGRDLIDSIPVC
ncbi:hypothetical protein G5I_03185 [Acromyrmex echinatior]|uniref:Uncharacterized protein n=1 Tax=Acromyrmex echinatior TaxID=103372 RepID=F4WCB1_ACREC|nr:hypothetical protein G5I_03185 [Acromyrmex echinatior]